MKKIILVIVICCNIGMIIFGLKNFAQTNILNNQILSLNADLTQANKKIFEEKEKVQDIEEKYKNIETVKAKVQKELQEQKSEAQRLAMELSREKQKRRELERKLKRAEKEVKTLKTKLKEEKDKGKKFQDRLNKMASRLEKKDDGQKSLLNKLTTITKERDELKKQIKRIEDARGHYSLDEITISEQKQYAGIVLNVNSKHHFCIISIGKDEVIVPGIELIVHRQSKLIGKVKVEKVFSQMSSAKILSVTDGEEIKVEDGIRKF